MYRLIVVAIASIFFTSCFTEPGGGDGSDSNSSNSANSSNSSNSEDCDSEERCDGIDNDCDGEVDEGFDVGVSCTVGEGGCAREGTTVCAAAGDETLCDAEPGEPSAETCDGTDEDCDGEVDEDFEGLGEPCFAGLGECAVEGVVACSEDGGDAVCDATAESPPEDDEVTCDGLDNDCDGEVDEGCDDDLDGYCDVDMIVAAEGADVCPNGGGDCDDDDESINPAADEICDGVDNDCDGATDEDDAVDAPQWYGDCDSDGYAAANTVGVPSCEEPTVAPGGCTVPQSAGWTMIRPTDVTNSDCDDVDPRAFPGQTEYFSLERGGNTINTMWDFNCDGSIEHQYTNSNATCFNCETALGQSAGWTGEYPPGCGITAEFQKCLRSGLSCDNDIVMVTQACR